MKWSVIITIEATDCDAYSTIAVISTKNRNIQLEISARYVVHERHLFFSAKESWVTSKNSMCFDKIDVCSTVQ